MADLLQALSSFSASDRRAALEELASTTAFPAENDFVNMHLHTFFSYNGEGWSPSRIAYEMKKLGLFAAAICDFDVLQGLDEFIAAADLLKLRSAVSFESRVFFKEYSDVEINSPGEPGVFYFMGSGFAKVPEAGTHAASVLADMLERSHNRNRAVIDRINAKLDDFSLDYDNDVLPLTPDKNATERHIIAAYNAKAEQVYGGTEAAARKWAAIFGTDAGETVATAQNYNKFNEFLRGKLIKKGGIGYAQPTSETFPELDKVIEFILECGGLPVSAWLDGSSAGEADPREQLACLAAKGVAAVNIIPDRNWNFKDPEVKAKRMAALVEYVLAAEELDMPIFVGTEANKPGQRLVDGFDGIELSPYVHTFKQGAAVMVGHTRMLRFAGRPLNASVNDELFRSRKERNNYYAKVGMLPCPELAKIDQLLAMGQSNAEAAIADAVKKGTWN